MEVHTQIPRRKSEIEEESEEIPKVNGRILSIQSHVVYGYVGNKAATFPLQLLNFQVDPINSVQFSNHTGYPSFKGQRLGGEQLWELIEGLEGNKLLQYTHMLTGYIGSVSFAETIIRVVKKLREGNPSLFYACDPVMGDYTEDGSERTYVPLPLIQLFRDDIIPLANIVTPNQYESELLTNIKIHSIEDAVKVCDALHAKGPSMVVITSLYFKSYQDVKDITLVGSHKKGDECKRFKIVVPRYQQYFSGVGDILSALLLGWNHRYPDDLKSVCDRTINTIHAILRRTMKMSEKEIQIVASREHILNPPQYSFITITDLP